MASTEENRINDGAPAKEEGGVEKSPLYRKMTIVMHIVIFLYSAAFWIQVGVMPVSLRGPWVVGWHCTSMYKKCKLVVVYTSGTWSYSIPTWTLFIFKCIFNTQYVIVSLESLVWHALCSVSILISPQSRLHSAVSLKETWCQPGHVRLHGDSLCRVNVGGGAAVWSLWGPCWLTCRSHCRLCLVLPDLRCARSRRQHSLPLLLSRVWIHDARHAR